MSRANLTIQYLGFGFESDQIVLAALPGKQNQNFTGAQIDESAKRKTIKARSKTS